MRAKENVNAKIRKKIIRNYKKGNSMGSISEETGVKLITIFDVLNKAGVEIRKVKASKKEQDIASSANRNNL